MSHLVEIAFKGNRRDFFRWDGAEPPHRGGAVIVEGDRGEDFGRVHATGELAFKRYTGVAHGALAYGVLHIPAPSDDGEPAAGVVPGDGVGPQLRVLRPATDADVVRAAELPALDETARRESAERVRAHALIMKITDAEWQWDRRKLTLYFTAEKRVDFRALVRDLAGHFRTRIELKQIGVRDEAKRLSGVGRCGREYCSAAWLPELRPVNLNVAKDQHLSLNPTQISGACGRLMCSLRYEHDFYVQQRKRFPKEGRVLATARGEEKVLGNDIFRERVTLRGLDGETRVVPLAELRAELEAASEGAMAGGRVAGEPMRSSDASDDVPARTAAPALAAPVVPEPTPVALAVVPPASPDDRGAAEALAVARQAARHAADDATRDLPNAVPSAPDADANDAASDTLAFDALADDDESPTDAPAGADEAPVAGDTPPDGAERQRRRRGRRGGRRNRSSRPDA